MRLSAVIIFLFQIFTLLGQESKLAGIDGIVNYQVANKQFSGVVLVAEEGQSVYHKAFGVCHLTEKKPITVNTKFSIASITKLFTSIIILQLVEENKLQLDQSLQSLLPTFQIPKAKQITIHHLLLHISGLPNESDKIYRSKVTPSAYVKASLKNKSKSGFESFNYNNVDYVLLGLIIEKITNTPWKEVVRKRILEQLDMEDTGFLALNNYPEDFAYTYTISSSGKKRQDPQFYIENFYAAANMFSTSLDLLKLDQALYNNTLLNEASRKKLAKSYPEFGYVGYSVWNYQYPYAKSKPIIMERRGGILGANLVLIRLTDSNQTIIILSNNDQFTPDSFGDENNLREALIREIGK